MQIKLSPHCSSHQLVTQIDFQKLDVYDQFSETRKILSLLKAFLRIKGYKDARILHAAQTESGFVLWIYYFRYFSETCQSRERQSERKIRYLRISYNTTCLPPPTPLPFPPPSPHAKFCQSIGLSSFLFAKPR